MRNYDGVLANPARTSWLTATVPWRAIGTVNPNTIQKEACFVPDAGKSKTQETKKKNNRRAITLLLLILLLRRISVTVGLISRAVESLVYFFKAPLHLIVCLCEAAEPLEALEHLLAQLVVDRVPEAEEIAGVRVAHKGLRRAEHATIHDFCVLVERDTGLDAGVVTAVDSDHTVVVVEVVAFRTRRDDVPARAPLIGGTAEHVSTEAGFAVAALKAAQIHPAPALHQEPFPAATILMEAAEDDMCGFVTPRYLFVQPVSPHGHPVFFFFFFCFLVFFFSLSIPFFEHRFFETAKNLLFSSRRTFLWLTTSHLHKKPNRKTQNNKQ
jgi:hypothetical protein